MSSPRKTTTGSPPSICLFHICYEIHPYVVEPIKDLLSTKIERKLEQLSLRVSLSDSSGKDISFPRYCVGN